MSDRSDRAIEYGATGAAIGSGIAPGVGTGIGGGLGALYGYFSGDEAGDAADALAAQQRETGRRYGEYRPDAMGLRRQSLQSAMGLFGPLAQYTQRMTGAPPPDVAAMFGPLQHYEKELGRRTYGPQGGEEAPAPSATGAAPPVMEPPSPLPPGPTSNPFTR